MIQCRDITIFVGVSIIICCIFEVEGFNRTFHLRKIETPNPSGNNYLLEIYLEDLGPLQTVNTSIRVPNGTVIRIKTNSSENLSISKQKDLKDTRHVGKTSHIRISDENHTQISDENHTQISDENHTQISDGEMFGEIYIQMDNDTKEIFYQTKGVVEQIYIFHSTSSSSSCKDGYMLTIMFMDMDCSQRSDKEICNGHGICQDNVNMFSCVCCEGYFGRYCEDESNITRINKDTGSLIQETQDDNLSNGCIEKCYGHDNCSKGGVFARLSSISFSNCENMQKVKSQKLEDTTVCKSEVCLHGECRSQVGKASCFCDSGYYGNQCQYKYDGCFSNPCKNGGSCQVLDGGYRCKCTVGYSGTNCSIKMNLCVPNPCKQNTRCYDIGDEYFCNCPRGLAGKHCDKNVNECDPNPCLRLGKCRDMIGGYRCLCKDGTAGNKCEFFIDIFAPPMESQVSGVIRGNHLHNLYTVAGVLTGIFLLVLIVFVSCYCRANNFCGSFFPCCNRIGSNFRKISSTSNVEVFRINKPNLSLDALLDAMSPRRHDLCSDRGEPLLVREV